MALFVCDGVCEVCCESDCPFKYDDDFREVIEYNKVMDLIENEILNPDSLIDLMGDIPGYSLFNVINAWKLTNVNISKRDIQKQLLGWLPSNVTKDMSPEIYTIFQKSILTITQKIYNSLNNECVAGECFQCVIREYCPFLQNSIMQKKE